MTWLRRSIALSLAGGSVLLGLSLVGGCLMEDGAEPRFDVEGLDPAVARDALDLTSPELEAGGDALPVIEASEPPITQGLVQTGPDAQMLAQAACTAMKGAGGWTFAIRRECTAFAADCATTCANITEDQAGPLKCFNALHVYANEPRTSAATVGLKTYRYNSCTGGGCGPNYCCCGN
jgi:hypothetical protein